MSTKFMIPGNICADRIKLGRALQSPPITQEELAIRIQLMGYADMTKLIISRIESNRRHVCDVELKIIAEALNVSMEWLVGKDDALFPKRSS
ncbi:MAG: helix-turn-helix domain-containing protein [Clostridia bacterium]